jgi:hypothetical protein
MAPNNFKAVPPDGQSYKTFFTSPLTMNQNKLERFHCLENGWIGSCLTHKYWAKLARDNHLNLTGASVTKKKVL